MSCVECRYLMNNECLLTGCTKGLFNKSCEQFKEKKLNIKIDKSGMPYKVITNEI